MFILYFVGFHQPHTMESILCICRLFRRLIIRIRGLSHTDPAVCRHCNISGGVTAKLREASRRGHIECVNACIAARANVGTEGTTWGVLAFRYFRRDVLMFKCCIFYSLILGVFMFKYFHGQMLPKSTGCTYNIRAEFNLILGLFVFRYFRWGVLIVRYFQTARVATHF